MSAKWTCVHDHLSSAASRAAELPGAVQPADGIAWVPSGVLPPGWLYPANGVSNGFVPDDGSVYRYDSRGAGCTSHERAKCPNPLCMAAEGHRPE